MPNLSKQAILRALGQSEAALSEFPIDPTSLSTEYALAEAIDAAHLSLEETDMVVVLSGRSGFNGAYVEAADKFRLCEEYDVNDTMRRMTYGINIAKKCTQYNLEHGIKKPVYVYFNGLQCQNNELREILRTKGAFQGYPAQFFIIDSIPFDNTMGQVLALSYFLDTQWNNFSNMHKLTRAPNLVICSSSYHVPRVTLAHGANSPLLTADFWQKQPELVQRLTPTMQNYILNPGTLLKKSSLIVLGCDRKITANPCWEKDLNGDMEARVRYSYAQKVPSIALRRAENDVTVKRAIEKMNLYALLKNHAFLKPVPAIKYADAPRAAIQL